MSGEPLYLLGARVRARLILDLLEWRFEGRYEVLGAFDDAVPAGAASEARVPMLGTIDDAAALAGAGTRQAAYLLAMGGPSNIRACDVLDSLTVAGGEIVSLVPQNAFVSESAVLGHNTVMMPGVFIGARATLGDLVFIHGGAVVEHDSRIGRNVMIAPGATIAGSVVVGDHSFIGAGATIADGTEIGEGCVIGAGSVVVAPIPAYSVAYGVPARRAREVSTGMYAPTREEIAAWKARRA
jgi:sugar O-acyltransferase (sialic acid O-acetyltransferase NeuD family)